MKEGEIVNLGLELKTLQREAKTNWIRDARGRADSRESC